jgi:hypothetical protein
MELMEAPLLLVLRLLFLPLAVVMVVVRGRGQPKLERLAVLAAGAVVFQLTLAELVIHHPLAPRRVIAEELVAIPYPLLAAVVVVALVVLAGLAHLLPEALVV